MIEYDFYAPAEYIDPSGPSMSIEYTTRDEPDHLEIDEQIIAQFLGLA